MLKVKKKLMIAACLIAAAAGIASCGTKQTSDNSKIPTIKWYVRYEEQKDNQRVLEKVNEITQKNIGAKLEIKRVDAGDYGEKIKLAMASNESFDLCHMAPRYDFYSHVTKGAFQPVDELMQQYAPVTYSQIPEAFWEATKVDGRIMGVINYQIVGRQNGFVAQKALLEKYNFDLDGVKKLEDIEPFLESVKNGEPANVSPIGINGGTYTWAMTHYIGFDAIGSESYPGVIKISDDNYTVVNQYESKEFLNYCKQMQSWYEKGYIANDAATATNGADMRLQGLEAVFLDNVAPGYEPMFAKQMGDRPVDTVVIDPPFVNTSNIIATMTCLSKTSENPEKAMQLLELINTDADGIYNLLCFGIEGVHYNKVGERRIEKIADSGYDPNSAWMFGNNFNAYLIPGQEDDLWEQTMELNKNATPSKLLGFTLDTEPIKIELSQCKTVIDEYIPSLTTGAVNPEEYISQFINKLKKANVDKIIAEEQRQIDEWLKTR